jgi:dTDP-4-amino-4,6-dideoxygalactose transaminase
MAPIRLPLDPAVPAVLGGRPVFPDRLPLARPRIANPARVRDDIDKILASGKLTNGRYVRDLEERAAEYLGVRECVAVASCTSGLMLVLRVSELSGDVVVPSFTFAATAHAVAWNGLRVSFADIDPGTLTLSPVDASRAAGVRTAAILATHVFGTPCDIERLQEVARRNGTRLFFDAAHAFGSRHQGVPVGGFGDAEVFSLSPTKLLVAGEGGIIATNDEALARACRIGRDYGNPGDYNCRFVGLNARMSEVHAAIGLASLETLEERVERRNALARRYRDLLAAIPGITFPRIPEGDRSTYKDFTVLVDPASFGLDATKLAEALDAEGIETRRYYAPAVHEQQAYRSSLAVRRLLPVTEEITPRVLTLPLWPELTDEQLGLVAEAMARIRDAFIGLDLRVETARGDTPVGSERP